MITMIPEKIVLVAEKGQHTQWTSVTEPYLNQPSKVWGKAWDGELYWNKDLQLKALLSVKHWGH
jgi:hypothetical protein